MGKVSEVVNEIYNKILPIAEKINVEVDLDTADNSAVVADDEAEILKKNVEEELARALDASDGGTIGITVRKDAVVISDSGTILSPAMCQLLSTERVEVKSRVGFGTTVEIKF